MKPLLIPSCFVCLVLLVGCSQANPVYNDSPPGKGPSGSGSSPAQTRPESTPPVKTTRTQAPVPTKPYTLQPTRTQSYAALTASSAKPTSPPTALPSKIPQPDGPPAPIQIFGPGPRSKVTSPIQVETQLTSQGGKLLRIELRGDDGRLLSRIVKLPNVYPWSSAQLSLPLFFELSSPSENGRLTVSIDDQYGRTMDLNSTGLTMLSSGDPTLIPASSLAQALVIRQPAAGERISGGVVLVAGILQGDIRLPIRAELISQDGKILGHRIAASSINPDGTSGQFKTGIIYSIDRRTRARLAVYIDSENGGQILHLSSIEITLEP